MRRSSLEEDGERRRLKKPPECPERVEPFKLAAEVVDGVCSGECERREKMLRLREGCSCWGGVVISGEEDRPNKGILCCCNIISRYKHCSKTLPVDWVLSD